MDIPIERIKLSQTEKDQLTRLKKITKIEQWNILCRWAFCRSLAQSSIPVGINIKSDSNVEMTWQVFGGEMAEILLLALKHRCYKDGLGLEKDILTLQFRLHLNRGIGYLVSDNNLNSFKDLVNLITITK